MSDASNTVDRATAEEWLANRLHVPRGTIERLMAFEVLLREEAARQNLIAASTLPNLWWRHFIDSAQLLLHTPLGRGTWIDVGAGAGLPGLIVAILSSNDVLLVEPRRKRADFLTFAASELGIASKVSVRATKVERFASAPAAVISARAVAPLDQLFTAAAHLSHAQTVWVLPKGRSAAEELAQARAAWHGQFRTEPSVTDPEAAIVVAAGVRRKQP